MLRSLVLCCLTLLIFVPQVANAQSTSDPGHKGWIERGGEQVALSWEGYETNCEVCAGLAETYNTVMEQLFELRNEIKSWEDTLRNKIEDQKPREENTDKGLSEEDEKMVAEVLNRQLSLIAFRDKQIPRLQAQERALSRTAKDLRAQIGQCERRSCPDKASKGDRISKPGETVTELPFEWQGPYPAVCHKCAKLAARLNSLPDLARETMGRIAVAETKKTRVEFELQAHRWADLDISYPWGNNRHRIIKQEVKKLEKEIAALEREIDQHTRNLEKIENNFSETAKMYEDCVAGCKEAALEEDEEDDKRIGCVVPDDATSPIRVGANSEVGTGAAMKDKAKGAAMGAASKALGGLLGGGGISFGGGGGGSSADKGPETVKDPLRKLTNRHLHEFDTGFEISMRAGFTDDGLTVSQKIKDSPGNKSTFHAVWLQDSDGKVIMPTTYMIYDLYTDHKLSVWWTYDHWTNGVHDAHEEGGWTEEWRTYDGTFIERLEGEEHIENSLWYQAGFSTAVKGVQAMGFVFDVGPEDLAGPCGLTLISHLTMPSEKPDVKTGSIAYQLGMTGPEGREIDIKPILSRIP